jgi:hypothetical protein
MVRGKAHSLAGGFLFLEADNAPELLVSVVIATTVAVRPPLSIVEVATAPFVGCPLELSVDATLGVPRASSQ